MNCLIVDDEASARARLKRLLAAHADTLTVMGEAADGLAALEAITTQQPALVFLDIEMPGLNGFQVLQALPAATPLPLVVFVTGYDQHALAAFEANALAYLLKPVETERLAQAVERAQRLHHSAERDAPAAVDAQAGLSALLAAPPANFQTPLRYVVGRKRDRFLLLQPTDIRFFRIEDGLVRAHTADDKFLVNYQLNQLEAALPAEQFFRAHRSALINLLHVRELRPHFKGSFLLLMNDAAQTEILVSERQAPALRRRFPGL